MRCLQCGNELEDGTRFCTRCGQRAGGEGVDADREHSRRHRNPWFYTLIIAIGVLLVAGVSVAVTLGLRHGSPANYRYGIDYRVEGLRAGPGREQLVARELNYFLQNIGIRDFAIVTRSDGDRLYVTIRLANPDDQLRLTGSRGGLQFRLVEDSKKASEVANDPVWRETPTAERAPDKEVVLPYGEAKAKMMLRLGPALMTGESIKKAKADASDGDWKIYFTLTDEGASEFDEITTRNANRQLAILLDYRVLSAPTIREPITEGTGEITGKFTRQDAENIAAALNAGNLPFWLDKVKEGEK